MPFFFACLLITGRSLFRSYRACRFWKDSTGLAKSAAATIVHSNHVIKQHAKGGILDTYFCLISWASSICRVPCDQHYVVSWWIGRRSNHFSHLASRNISSCTLSVAVFEKSSILNYYCQVLNFTVSFILLLAVTPRLFIQYLKRPISLFCSNRG